MPIVQLFNRSSSLAEAALCSTKPDDLELAFVGNARGAFLSLQCFLSEEEEWCYTRGCPGRCHLRASKVLHIWNVANVISQRALRSQPSRPSRTYASS